MTTPRDRALELRSFADKLAHLEVQLRSDGLAGDEAVGERAFGALQALRAALLEQARLEEHLAAVEQP